MKDEHLNTLSTKTNGENGLKLARKLSNTSTRIDHASLCLCVMVARFHAPQTRI